MKKHNLLNNKIQQLYNTNGLKVRVSSDCLFRDIVYFYRPKR